MDTEEELRRLKSVCKSPLHGRRVQARPETRNENPLIKLGPGGDFTQDIYARDLGVTDAGPIGPHIKISKTLNQEGA